jgi:ATPase subunit of ABC transporter with duplicated ATPase domains
MSRRAAGYDSDLEDYERECRRFRICIIGRAGVGKSTLLSRVFGISDKEVLSRWYPRYHLGKWANQSAGARQAFE